MPSALGFLCRAAGLIGLPLACGGDAGQGEVVHAGIGGEPSVGGAGGELGVAVVPSEGGAGGGPPNAHVQALAACDVEEPCGADSGAYLNEGEHYIPSARTLCVLSALAQRRVGRYAYETSSTFGNGGARAYHILVVRSDGTVAYVRETSHSLSPPEELDELPPIEPLRCTLKPSSYFEACRAAVEALPGPGMPQVYPPDDAVAWSCTFGDGGRVTPSSLLWFESCVSEMPLRCE